MSVRFQLQVDSLAIRGSFASFDYDLSSSWLYQGLIVPASCAALTFAQ